MIIIKPYKLNLNTFIDKNSELLKDLFFYLINWIDSNPDIDRFLESKESYKHFSKFIYSKYITPYERYRFDFQKDFLYDHYDIKYSSDILDIFNVFKEYSRGYNSNIFFKKHDSSIDLIDFIYSICDYNEPYIDDRVKEEDLHAYELDEFEVIEYER